ncbi:MAG: Ig-like domain-containing domain [Planctomycetota bacterium]|jgi:hypothetical protein
MTKRATRKLAVLIGMATLASCGGGSSTTADSIGSGMKIVSCSLGCATTLPGPVSCSQNQVFVNQELAIEFTQPVDPSSLNSLSFRVVSETGSSPQGEYVVDPQNPRRAIYRPKVTFGSDGLPIFGFDPNLSYTVSIPAPGGSTANFFFVESVTGAKNSKPLECTLLPTLGVADVVPGPPVVTIFVEEIVDGAIASVTNILETQPGVSTSSRLRFEFDDVMNPATLVNTVTQQSAFIDVRVDIDGILTDNTDQLPIPGSFSIDIDDALGKNSTTVLFTPASTFPTAGVDDGGPPRQIVVVLPPAITDLGGNSLANAGEYSFTTTTQPEAIQEAFDLAFDAGVTGEQDFQDANLDGQSSGMLIQADYVFPEATGGGIAGPFQGRLLRGLGGGNGRLGDLVVEPGEEVVLSTGPIPTFFGKGLTTGPVEVGGVITAYNVSTQITDDYPIDPFPDVNGFEWYEDGDPTTGPGQSVVEVTDGVFEFASVVVKAGARLTFVGETPPRVFVRGTLDVDGLVRAEGSSARTDVNSIGEYDENPGSGPKPGPDTNGNGVADGLGSVGAAGGPGGGDGGSGGSRSDVPAFIGLGPSGGGVANAAPGGSFPWGEPGFASAPADLTLDGTAGEGRNGESPSGGNDFGAGPAGGRFPVPFPGQTTGQLEDFGGLVTNSFCQSVQFGPGGAGGSFSAPGESPTYVVPPGLAPLGGVVIPDLPVGSSDLLVAAGLELDPSRGGALIGGAGGGGGGTGSAYAKTSGLPFNCSNGNPAIAGGQLQFLEFVDALAGGGGGGGGAIQIQAGNLIEVNGAISTRGGAGGGLTGVDVPTRGAAAPGGGGSGGSILLQAYQLDLADFPGIVDVSGGDGGFTQPIGSNGGKGGPGVVRLENGFSLASKPEPFSLFATSAMLPENEVTKVAPSLSLTNPSGVGGPFFIDDVLALEGFEPNTTGPGARFGVQTCWLVPQNEAFAVEFQGDSVVDGQVVLGWDLKLELGSAVAGTPLGSATGAVVSFRSDEESPLSPFTGGLSLEQAAGNSIATSPIAVRFQGARAVEPIDDPCQLFLSGPASPLLQGSLTPWLSSPAEVSEYWKLLTTLNPAVDQNGTPAEQQADLDAQIDPADQIQVGLASQRQANIIRAQVVFNENNPIAQALFAVVQLELTALTD